MMQANNMDELRKENKKLTDEIMELKKRIQKKENKIEELIQRNKEEKIFLFQELRSKSARNCHRDCVLCTMVWFCSEILNLLHICGRQLEKIILVTVLTRKDIKIDNKKELLKCEGLMTILQQCEIVVLASKYEYPKSKTKKETENNQTAECEQEDRNSKIAEAWSSLMSLHVVNREQYVILGRISEDDVPGHIEVSDFKAETDGNVTIHDPQSKETSFNVDKESFRKHVIDDAGLLIYTVKWEDLKLLIQCYDDILHCAKQCTSDKKCTNACVANAKNE
jgi:hypothetical protein